MIRIQLSKSVIKRYISFQFYASFFQNRREFHNMKNIICDWKLHI